MSPNNFIISSAGTITVIINGKPHTATREHPNYSQIYENLEEGCLTDLELLFDVAKSIEHSATKCSSAAVSIKDGVLYYHGEALHGSLTDRIVQMVRDGFIANLNSFFLFLENLMENPSRQSVQELYDFLANAGLPITEDGCFLAYKGLDQNYKDRHSGTFDNSPGNVVSIRRNKVDDDRNRTCSYGLHVGTFDYASTFAGGGPVVLVKVNPKDVVSVPLDCGAGKCRTCEYLVLETYEDSTQLNQSLYTHEGQPLEDDKSSKDFDVAQAITYYLGLHSSDLENAVLREYEFLENTVVFEEQSLEDLAKILAYRDDPQLDVEDVLAPLRDAVRTDAVEFLVRNEPQFSLIQRAMEVGMPETTIQDATRGQLAEFVLDNEG